MKSIKFFGPLLVVLGLLLANVSFADQLILSERTIQWSHEISDNGFIRVSYKRSVPATTPAITVQRVGSNSTDTILVVDKLLTYWVKSPYSHGRVRVTVPMRYYLTSWDVKALERELERLGVKGKPKPMPPKPVSFISG